MESFYYMWRTTRDIKWVERGWEVFKAIERECKMANGYASVKSVETSPAPHKNEMPSFFMAETCAALLPFLSTQLILS